MFAVGRNGSGKSNFFYGMFSVNDNLFNYRILKYLYVLCDGLTH